MSLTQDFDAALAALETLRANAQAKREELSGGPSENGAFAAEAVVKAAKAANGALYGKPEVRDRLQNYGL